MITGISIVAVPVDDIDEALRFYCQSWGWRSARTFPGVKEPGRATIGEYSRVVLRVADVRRAYEELTAQGVRFEREPFDLPRGTFAALRDPWDNLFVLTDGADF